MIKAIIFDFAGVITSEGFWAWLGENVSDLENKKDLFMSLADKADKGEVPEEEYRKELAEASGRPVENIPGEILDLYTIDESMLALLQNLRKTVKIGLLSNFPSGWIRKLLKKHMLEDYFDEIVVSSEVHMIKPEKEIFDYTLSLLNTSPAETVFVDDREKNVVGAQKVGLKGIVFTSLPQLKKDLQKLEVEIS